MGSIKNVSNRIHETMMSGKIEEGVSFQYIENLLKTPEGRRAIPVTIVKRLSGFTDFNKPLMLTDEELEQLVTAHYDEIQVELFMMMANSYLLQSVSPTYFLRGLVFEKLVGFYDPYATLDKYIHEPELLVDCYSGPNFLKPFVLEHLHTDKAFRLSCVEYLQRNMDLILKARPDFITAIRRMQHHVLELHCPICHVNTLCDGEIYKSILDSDTRRNYRLILAVAMDELIEKLQDQTHSVKQIWQVMYDNFVARQADISITTGLHDCTVVINGQTYITGLPNEYEFDDYLGKITPESVYKSRHIMEH